MKRPRFDLREIAARSGKAPRKRAATLRPIPSNRAFEQEAARIGLRVIAAWLDVAVNLLTAYEAAVAAKARDAALTLDAAGDNLSVLLASESQSMGRFITTLDPEVMRWSSRVETWQRKRFAQTVRAGFDIDIFPYLSGQDVEDEIAAAIERFTSLIRGLSADAERRVGETVWREYLKQTPRREVGKLLSEQLQVGRTRANLIAKDQTLKLSAQLNQERQEQVGITQYVWRTAEDERVRPTHAERNGEVYEWDDVSQIKPGEEINCRCTAQAYLEPSAAP